MICENAEILQIEITQISLVYFCFLFLGYFGELGGTSGILSISDSAKWSSNKDTNKELNVEPRPALYKANKCLTYCSLLVLN